RFKAYGWHAAHVADGNDIEEIARAIEVAREDDRPSLIAIRTHIGFGSPNRQDTQKAHGQPLGEDEVRLVKENYGWDPDAKFFVPDAARELFRRAIPAGEAIAEAWHEAFAAYERAFPDLADGKGSGEFQPDEPGRNIRFGVREHAMGGIANGIAYHGGFIPYVGTFLTFSDYMRGSVRLASLSGLHVIYVWTHDSVGLGE